MKDIGCLFERFCKAQLDMYVFMYLYVFMYFSCIWTSKCGPYFPFSSLNVRLVIALDHNRPIMACLCSARQFREYNVMVG